MSADPIDLERLKRDLTDNERIQLEIDIRSRTRDVGTCIALACLGFVGIAGIHRFMLGKMGTGVLWLLTGGLCLIGTIVDLVNMDKMVREFNYQAEYQAIQEFLARKRVREEPDA